MRDHYNALCAFRQNFIAWFFHDRIIVVVSAPPNPSVPSSALRWAWGIFFVSLAAVIALQGWRFLTRDMIDFTVIHRTGQRLLEALPIYDFRDDIMLFKYAPFIAYLIMPFAYLPKVPSALVFFTLSVLAFTACFVMSYRWVVPAHRKGWVAFGIVALAVLSTLRVIMNSLDFGQVHVFILLGMLFAAKSFGSDKALRGGFVLSLLTLSKIVPGVLCVPWLLRRNLKPAATTGLFCLLLLAAPILWLGLMQGFTLTGEWWNVLHVTTNQSMIEHRTNQSLLSALARILADNHYHVNIFEWDIRRVIVLTNAILLAWLGGILWLGARRDEARFPSLGFARALDASHYFLLIILAFPLAWRYHFISMILPNMLILAYLFCYARKDYLTWGLFVGAFCLSSLVNQELLGSKLFEWFYLRSCLAVSVGITLIALLRIELRVVYASSSRV
jgi:hypothetical protein